MRTRFDGICHYCKGFTPKGMGHFERFKGGWKVRCVCCVSDFKKNDSAIAELQQFRASRVASAPFNASR